jgi:2'-5' RNA ligase
MTWLAPADGPVRDEIAAIIGGLAAEHDAPRFPPHVTVVVGFSSAEDEAARVLGSLAAGVPPLRVSFGAFGHEDEYFRSLYLRAEPSRRLTDLHEAARRAWPVPPAPYRPHLSLLYSSLGAERKRAIIDAIPLALPVTLVFDALELWAGASGDAGVSGWRRVARERLPAPA